MATPSSAPLFSDSDLNGAWAAYRLWACTARHAKKNLDRLTNAGLWLAIGGSITATAADQYKGQAWGKWMGVGAGAAVAAAAFFSQQAQSGDRVRTWTRSRSAAESLKSGIYLYRTGARPFDGPDRAVQMKARLDKVIADMQGIEPRIPAQENAPKLGPMSVAEYADARVKDQIGWYQRRAAELQKKADLCRWGTGALAVLGVVLTAVSATVIGVSVWVPVVATVAAAITAYLKSQQLQMLTATYAATGIRLQVLLDGGVKGEVSDFVTGCEETMATENGGWVGLWNG